MKIISQILITVEVEQVEKEGQLSSRLASLCLEAQSTHFSRNFENQKVGKRSEERLKKSSLKSAYKQKINFHSENTGDNFFCEARPPV